MTAGMQRELEVATTLAETKLNVAQAHAAAAIAQNEQLAQAATEAVQQLDEASQTIQDLSTRAERQAEEHRLRISQVSPIFAAQVALQSCAAANVLSCLAPSKPRCALTSGCCSWSKSSKTRKALASRVMTCLLSNPEGRQLSMP